MDYAQLIYGVAAIICAALLAFVATPLIRVLAYRLGAIDVPKDARRMHTTPIPRMGGVANLPCVHGNNAGLRRFCTIAGGNLVRGDNFSRPRRV